MDEVSPAYTHVLEAVSGQMDASRKVLTKLRRGKRLYPRISIVPALFAVASVALDLGVWAIVLSIASTSALLIGSLTYALVERRLVTAIRGSVTSLDALSREEHEALLATWLRD